jgi:hypothetical protein
MATKIKPTKKTQGRTGNGQFGTTTKTKMKPITKAAKAGMPGGGKAKPAGGTKPKGGKGKPC